MNCGEGLNLPLSAEGDCHFLCWFTGQFNQVEWLNYTVIPKMKHQLVSGVCHCIKSLSLTWSRILEVESRTHEIHEPVHLRSSHASPSNIKDLIEYCFHIPVKISSVVFHFFNFVKWSDAKRVNTNVTRKCEKGRSFCFDGNPDDVSRILKLLLVTKKKERKEINLIQMSFPLHFPSKSSLETT